MSARTRNQGQANAEDDQTVESAVDYGELLRKVNSSLSIKGTKDILTTLNTLKHSISCFL